MTCASDGPFLRRLRPAGTAAVLLMGLALAPQEAFAQARSVVERNLPPAVTTPGGGLTLAPSQAGAADDTPLGVDLRGIRLIGLKDQVLPRPPSGVTLTGVEGAPEDRLRTALAPLVGRPLSLRLVADAQAAVAKVYREVGHPFVSVTAPPQEITSGVLQLRVVAFRAGKVAVKDPGADPAAAASLATNVRAPQGELIEANRISEDLDWLNRFPYRQLNGVFEPGSDLGTSDLTLEVTRRKPWQVYAGWSNTGTAQTDYNRYFVGFGVGLEALHDTTIAYQLTGSGNLVTDPASMDLSGDNWPSYVSHAGRVTIPTFARQALEIAPSFVATSQMSVGDIFTFQNETFELPILYRSAVSNLNADLAGWGDLYAGVAPKWLNRNTWYQGIEVAQGQVGVLDIIAGWNVSWLRPGGGASAIDLRLVANPGGGVADNTDLAWSLFTNGRVTSAQYFYAYGTFNQTTPLPALAGVSGLVWTTAFTGLAAGQALPDTEQLAIGGFYATRGYTLDDGSVDTGFVLRNELRLPAFPVLGRLGLKDPLGPGLVQDALVPFGFLDVAYGHNFNLNGVNSLGQGPNTTLVGIGAGLDYALPGHWQMSGVVGVALTDGPSTPAGSVTAQARVIGSF